MFVSLSTLKKKKYEKISKMKIKTIFGSFNLIPSRVSWFVPIVPINENNLTQILKVGWLISDKVPIKWVADAKFEFQFDWSIGKMSKDLRTQ